MLNHKIIKNKKGQIGETLTWIFSTIIIIVVLILLTYLTGLVSNARSLTVNLPSTISNIFYPGVKADFGGSVVLEEKTELSHKLANNKNKGFIDKILGEENE